MLLAEFLRIFFGTKAVGWDNLVYGVLLVLFIIFLPKGILGSILDRLKGAVAGGGSPPSAMSAAIASGASRPRTVSVGRGSAIEPGRQGRPCRAGRPRPARRGPRSLAASSSRAATFSVSPT